MPLLERKDLCSGVIMRVPGGWLFDRCFVPEPHGGPVELISTEEKLFSVNDMEECWVHGAEMGRSKISSLQSVMKVFFKERFNIEL